MCWAERRLVTLPLQAPLAGRFMSGGQRSGEELIRAHDVTITEPRRIRGVYADRFGCGSIGTRRAKRL